MYLKHKISQRTLNKLYIKVVKRPYMLLISVTIGMFFLILIASNTYRGVYIEIEEAVLQHTQEEGYQISAEIAIKDNLNIKENQTVLWYFSKEDIRYEGQISRITLSDYRNNSRQFLTLIIKPNEEDIKKELIKYHGVIRKRLTIEVMVDKNNLITFFKSNKENE